ncbi:uncharacterized protein LOC127797910 [Diospyros lotus]|uniref:uncharacterized protein LOC127797910 n=1 Tax=Diospyros lotus TaxID=55363 RepID=UPI00225A227A|nr:uncharacterized protein LOC127797910 [Diospyros lotus]
MAELFLRQGKHYAAGRPSYPAELFRFIASKTPCHDLAWDVATGTGQAASSLAGIYKNVIASDASQKQLDFAPKLPNVRYQCTPPTMSTAELNTYIAAEGSLDLVTIAQAMHWFDLPIFYQQVKRLLKPSHGILAAWCYTMPEINDGFDAIFRQFYLVDCSPFCNSARELVDNKYTTIDFPFEPVDGTDHTGPFEFASEKLMDLDNFLTFIRSWSAYQIAKEKGIELLTDDLINNFKRAWSEDGNDRKVLKFPIHLRIGKVTSLN